MQDEKKKKPKGYRYMGKSLSYYKPYKGRVTLMIFLALSTGIMTLLEPILMAEIVNGITAGNMQHVIEYGLYELALAAALNLVWGITYGAVMFPTNLRVRSDFRHNLTKSMMNLRTKDFDNTSSGLFITRLTNDSGTISETVSSSIMDLAWGISSVAFIFYICIESPYMGLYMFAMMFVIFAFNSIRLKLFKKNSAISKKANDALNGLFNESVRGVRDVKLLGIKENAIAKVDAQDKITAQKEFKRRSTNNTLMRAQAVVSAALAFGFLLLGSFLVTNKLLSIGIFLVTYFYLGKIVQLARTINQVQENLTDAEVSAERVYDVLEPKGRFAFETFGLLDTPLNKGEIEFQNVKFNYGDKTIFSDLSFKVENNTSVAIVGKSGEGKTTIFNMLTRAYPHDSGKILIDGVDITQVTENALKNAVAGVSQKPYIFNLSFRDNMRLVNPAATDAEIEEACRQAELHDFIVKQVKGYDTIVGENGVVLSGGQAQRLAIARMFLKGSKIMLLDEATSSLDNESQGKVQKVLEGMRGKHTTLIIAHRLSTIVNCDKIILIDNGKIAAEGTHKQLMKTSAAYRELYAMEETS